MAGISCFPRNPLEIVTGLALTLPLNETGAEITSTDEYNIEQMVVMAGALGYVGTRYSLEVGHCISAPARNDGKANYAKPIRFNQIEFLGSFDTYSKIVCGSSHNYSSVGAWCLLFEEVELIPDMDILPAGHVLHVPFDEIESLQLR